jgi:hypothetical protein
MLGETIFTMSLLLKTLIALPSARRSLSPYLHSSFSRKLKSESYLYSAVIPNIIVSKFLKATNSHQDSDSKGFARLNAGTIPLIDTITDKIGYTEQRLIELYENYDSVVPQNPYEETFIEVVVQLENLASDKLLFRKHFHSFLQAQIRSLNQSEVNDRAVLERILADKGGLAFVQLIAGINPKMTEKDYAALYQTGYYLQLIDDYVDYDKDLQNGVNTLATLSPSRESYKQLID